MLGIKEEEKIAIEKHAKEKAMTDAEKTSSWPFAGIFEKRVFNRRTVAKKQIRMMN